MQIKPLLFLFAAAAPVFGATTADVDDVVANVEAFETTKATYESLAEIVAKGREAASESSGLAKRACPPQYKDWGTCIQAEGQQCILGCIGYIRRPAQHRSCMLRCPNVSLINCDRICN
ncbi:hypothetical protein QIS74_09565 [Colletotrichum tabaci]|uniref:Uncharacterized protein n=1 Tax=Colletotrichum tabaci TaxID=1209068 RepID=A0AAV9T573_9PEZI